MHIEARVFYDQFAGSHAHSMSTQTRSRSIKLISRMADDLTRPPLSRAKASRTLIAQSFLVIFASTS
jgi:hypothetical protein